MERFNSWDLSHSLSSSWQPGWSLETDHLTGVRLPQQREACLVLLITREPRGGGEIKKRIGLLIGKPEDGRRDLQTFEHLNGFSASLNAEEVSWLISSGEVSAISLQADASVLESAGLKKTRQRRRKGRKQRRRFADNRQQADLATPTNPLNDQSSVSNPDPNSTAPPPADAAIDWAARLVLGGRNPAEFVEVAGNAYVFVLDTGITTKTGDMNVRTDLGYNFLNPGSSSEDDDGHGSHVAGIIGSYANGFGITGVAPGVNLVPYKVLNKRGAGSMATIASAIDRMIECVKSLNVDPSRVVANISFGARTEDVILRAAIERAAAIGIRFSIAAGNDAGDVDGATGATEAYLPASSRVQRQGVYVASAMDQNQKMASFSNYDRANYIGDIDNVTHAAPGVAVTSWFRTSDGRFSLQNQSGTSMAAAYVSGLLALGSIRDGEMAQANGLIAADPIALLA
jgi:subtilisin family serine protease